MKCGYCHRDISARDQRHAVTKTDEAGRIVAVYHRAHARTARGAEREGGPMPGRIYNEHSPSAYEVERVTKEDVEQEAADRQRAVLEEARREEQVPKSWADDRDPETATLEELTGGDVRERE